MAELRAQEAMAVQGAQEAMAELGEVRGYQEPSGARHRQTGHDCPPGLNRQDMTWQPTGTGSPPGLAQKLRLPLGMTRSQGPLQGPSATAFISTTGRQAAEMASAATKQGAACPRRVSMDKTWQDLMKMFLWAQQDCNTAQFQSVEGRGQGWRSETRRTLL